MRRQELEPLEPPAPAAAALRCGVSGKRQLMASQQAPPKLAAVVAAETRGRIRRARGRLVGVGGRRVEYCYTGLGPSDLYSDAKGAYRDTKVGAIEKINKSKTPRHNVR